MDKVEVYPLVNDRKADPMSRTKGSAKQQPEPEKDWTHGEIVDRRMGLDRRSVLRGPGEPDAGTNLERRRGPGRRRTDFMRAAEEGEMTDEQFLFILAVDTFKRVNGKTFPAWTDVLEVIRKLGYRKTLPSELNLGGRAVDWTEAADAPAGVFKVSREDEAVAEAGGEFFDASSASDDGDDEELEEAA